MKQKAHKVQTVQTHECKRVKPNHKEHPRAIVFILLHVKVTWHITTHYLHNNYINLCKNINRNCLYKDSWNVSETILNGDGWYSPISMSSHISWQSLWQVGSDTVKLLWCWQGVECQLLHVGLDQAILGGDVTREGKIVRQVIQKIVVLCCHRAYEGVCYFSNARL